ncbi:DNA polymerase III subunit beta family protein [Nocardia puris]|uniref:DNA-binding transcriptional MerR regulator n=1 Tax=Nocardia puris TaxID=208602 RepID=A0A366D9J5_9NOCA|nr:MerR family transcriptional regulator [Nocardia puris]RBO86615.1 DNA-binding transcriptional MerR regulator [Nocardia puris]
MPNSEELITIGALARASGLTASALRFYDDCGLLVPAEVDAVTGYRYYTRSQGERAALIRRLRGVEVPLDTIARVLAGDRDLAGRLLDEHAAALARRAAEAAAVAAEVKSAFAASVVAVPGPALAGALAQVVTAAASGDSVLAGVLIESDATALTLTATDRYRLSTRGLAPVRASTDRWSRVVEAAALEPLDRWLSGAGEIVLTPTDHGVQLSDGGIQRHCAGIAEEYPDYRAVLTGLPEVRTRVLVQRAELLARLETDAEALTFDITGGELRLAGSALPAAVTGDPLRITFSPAVLRPAIDTALGPEIMLDLAGHDLPAVVRSATDGALTSLAMPMLPPGPVRADGVSLDPDDR